MIGTIVTVHIGCGIVAVVCGAAAMLTRKGSRRHRRWGRLHLITLSGLGITAPVLAAVDWGHRWHLAVLGLLALGAAGAGFVAVRLASPARLATHMTGMGTAYIVMLTAFYVDNGPRLPLWDRLPALALWLLPAAVGAPVLVRALRRHRPGARTNSPARGTVPISRRPGPAGDPVPPRGRRGEGRGPDRTAGAGPVDGVQASGLPAGVPPGRLPHRRPPVLLIPDPPGADRRPAQPHVLCSARRAS